jgi:hypothetical protein
MSYCATGCSNSIETRNYEKKGQQFLEECFNASLVAVLLIHAIADHAAQLLEKPAMILAGSIGS